jgi:hypothetical protein
LLGGERTAGEEEEEEERGCSIARCFRIWLFGRGRTTKALLEPQNPGRPINRRLILTSGAFLASGEPSASAAEPRKQKHDIELLGLVFLRNV